ncbi:MAG: protein kinase, partial [Phycisphaerae bacterium]|nr:protein kinase [Phycisphaerae bacterium]
MSNPPTAPMGPTQSSQPGASQIGGQLGLKSGTKLGKYEIVGRLGLGGMALVYKGYDPLLDRFVAIKQIASHLAADPKFMERFRKEAQILAKLGTDQASVVQIYELIEDARGLFIVMEYVEGQTLDVLIAKQKGPMPIQLTLEVLWHLAVGLRAVHERSIIHRDIKPANVLVGVNHRCKITDFGVAARTGGKTSMTLGTTKYMAPELFGGDEVDGRVDIYSLGCIAFEMLCGQEKFQQIFHEVTKDDRAESLRWMKWHTNRELSAPMLDQINPHVPDVLAKIVAKMMAKDPAQRFASAEHLLEILKRHFTQQGTAKKQTAKAAKVAAAAVAAKAASGERKPEPIPERLPDGGGAVAAAVAASSTADVNLALPPGGPHTTRLPKRKMTRRQRLVVLSSLLALMLAAFATFQIYKSAIQNRIEARAGALYNDAREQWKKGNYTGARHTLGVLLADESLVKVDDQRAKDLTVKIDELPTGHPDRAKLEEERQAVLAEAKQIPLYRHLADAKTPTDATYRDWATGRLTWLDAKQALATASTLSRQTWPTREPSEVAAMSDADRQTWRANLEKKVQAEWAAATAARKTLAEQKIIPADEVRSVEKDMEFERNFLAKVKEALDKMTDGYKKLDMDLINQSKLLLDEAVTIKPREDLNTEYGYRLQLIGHFEHRQATEEARALDEAKRTAEAEKKWREILEKWPTDKEAKVRLGTYEDDRARGDTRAKIKAIVDA